MLKYRTFKNIILCLSFHSRVTSILKVDVFLYFNAFKLIYFALVVGKMDLRRGLRSGAEYMAVAVTTKLAPTKNENVGWKSNKNADMIHEMMIENDVANTFNTLSAYFFAQ